MTTEPATHYQKNLVPQYTDTTLMSSVLVSKQLADEHPPPNALRKVLLSLVSIAALVFSNSHRLEAQPPNSIRGPIQSLKDLPGNDCYSFELLEQDPAFFKGGTKHAELGWTTSGVWSKNDKLVLADLTFRRIAQVPIGGFVEQGPTKLRYATEKSAFEQLVAPWYMSPRPNGGFFLIDLRERADSRIYAINAHNEIDFYIQTQGRALRNEDGRLVEITGVFRIAPLATGVLAFADLKSGKEMWSSLIYLDKDDDSYYPFSGNFTELLSDLTEKYYARDLSYLTTIGTTGYILVYERVPWIGKVDLKSSQITKLDLPSDLNLRSPKLEVQKPQSRRETIEWLHTIYKTIEGSRMPVGVFSLESRLFLLVKDSAGEIMGETSWQVLELSPDDGSLLNEPVTLPTAAKHVSLIPGADFTALIEKAGIETLDNTSKTILYRPANKAVLLPSSWLSTQAMANLKAKHSCQVIDVNNSN